jgi:hypothetical protein
LTLVDLEKLVDLWIEHYERVSESDKRLLPLKPIYYLVWQIYLSSAARACGKSCFPQFGGFPD